MEPIWKTIDEYNSYEISSDGRVRNRKTQKILSQSKSTVTLWVNNKTLGVTVSHLMHKYFHESEDEWKIIETHPSYKISSTGKICHKRLINGTINDCGYHTVQLHLNGEPSNYLVHRLVATYFIPNPDNLPEVNHIDGNKCNNNIDNLEWVSGLNNKIHAAKNITKYHRVSVAAINPDTNIIVSLYNKIKDVEDDGFSKRKVSESITQKKELYNGFKWMK